MSEICVFAGTTEGRKLIEFLTGQTVGVYACVATEYGESLIPRGENVKISAARLNLEEMEALFLERRFDVVIDATHPFATQASEHIVAACQKTDTEYLRLNREPDARDEDAVYVDSIQGAADYLAGQTGNALLATGSKELAPYTAVEDYRERFYVRVLPMQASLEACEAVGFAPAHIIAMQGPFSMELNMAMLRAVDARFLVTKDSGDSGGFRDKLEAAWRVGAKCVVIGRPEQRPGMDYARVISWLKARFGLADVRDVAIVGIGMGAPEAMTREAELTLKSCDCVIGAARMLEAVERFGKPTFTEIASAKIAACMAAHPEYRRVAVVMSGDSGFFSGAKKLLPRLRNHRVRVIPGISSIQYLCARLETAWDDVHAVSLHGREGSVVPALRRYGKVFVLTDGSDALRRVCDDLCRAGMGMARVSLGERLSYPDERITQGTATELQQTACAPLSVMLLEHPKANAPLPVGLPDDSFLRQVTGGSSTVPMTKSEARAVSISRLRLTEDAVVYDIGAGTGSVSVEAALLCPAGHVYAVECRDDAALLVGRNADKFALRNLTVVHGTAPEALKALPAPTHAFIGGSSGSLRSIVSALLEKNPRVRIVVNAIALETVGEIAAIVRALGFNDSEIIQLSVARSRGVGRYHLMNGLNPIWIAAMQKNPVEVPEDEN